MIDHPGYKCFEATSSSNISVAFGIFPTRLGRKCDNWKFTMIQWIFAINMTSSDTWECSAIFGLGASSCIYLSPRHRIMARRSFPVKGTKTRDKVGDKVGADWLVGDRGSPLDETRRYNKLLYRFNKNGLSYIMFNEEKGALLRLESSHMILVPVYRT